MIEERFVLNKKTAILVHLAEMTGKLLPEDSLGRARVFEQLFFHASALSPAFGNAGFFKRSSPEPQPIAEARFTTEATRIIGLLDAKLAKQSWSWKTNSPSPTSHLSAGCDASLFPD